MTLPRLVLLVVAWSASLTSAYGQSITVPGRIDVENYVSSFDTTPGNAGGGCRTDNVDLYLNFDPPDPATGCRLTDTINGEWVSFTIFVTQAASYVLSARVASQGAGGLFHVEVDGVDVSGQMRVPNTDGWAAFQTIRRHGIELEPGSHTLTLKMDVVSATTGIVGAFNYLALTTSAPFGGTPRPVPGRIEIEDFDVNPSGASGEVYAYHDFDTLNLGGAYRTFESVDITHTSDVDGTYSVGWTSAGEWLAFTASIDVAGIHTFGLRVSHPGPGGTFHLEVDGTDVTGPIQVPDTGGWDSWVTVKALTRNLLPGTHVFYLVSDRASSLTGAVANVNYMTFVPGNNINSPNDFGRSRYGIVVGAFETQAEIDRFNELAPGSVRLAVSWRDSEPSDGGWNFGDLTNKLERLWGPPGNTNINFDNVSLFLTVGGAYQTGDVPLWAAPCGYCIPNDPATYGDFFQRVIEHVFALYPGAHVTFGVWNEPNLRERSDEEGHGFLNDSRDAEGYGRMFEQASLARDRVNQAIRIGGPETSHHARNDGYLANAMQRITPHLKPWDVITVHWYPDHRETIAAYMAAVSDMANGRQVWNTETGFDTCDDSSQAAAVVSIVEAMQLQVRNWWRTFIFRLWGPTTDWDPCSNAILRPDHSTRPAFTSYKGLIANIMSMMTLEPGETLDPGEQVTSVNGAFTLQYQFDGNLVVIRNSDMAPVWSSCTDGTSPQVTAMRTDGNLVIYDSSSNEVWTSRSDGWSGAFLHLDEHEQTWVVRRANGDRLRAGYFFCESTVLN